MSNLVVNSTALTDISPVVVWLPPNMLLPSAPERAGTEALVTASGTVTAIGSPELRFCLRAGGVSLGEAASWLPFTGTEALAWDWLLEVTLTAASGGVRTAVNFAGSVTLTPADGAHGLDPQHWPMAARPAIIDGTVPHRLTIAAQWGTCSPHDMAACDSLALS